MQSAVEIAQVLGVQPILSYFFISFKRFHYWRFYKIELLNKNIGLYMLENKTAPEKSYNFSEID